MNATLLLLLLWSAGGVSVQDPRLGEYTETFTEPHPLRAIPEFCRRSDWSELKIRNSDGKHGEFDLKGETFEIFVPDSYSSQIPFGLFVFTNSVESGKVPGAWKAILEKHRLIWVGANNSGNARPWWQRTQLALDAVHNLSTLYPLDPDRIYVSGPSGGGRSASMSAYCYPDVFSGGFFLIGAGYYRDFAAVGGGGTFDADFGPIPLDLLTRAKKNRYAIFTGGKDHFKKACLSIFTNGLKKDGFAHTEYFEAPGWGHTPPNAEWFEKGLRSLDRPLLEAATGVYAAAQKLEREGRLQEALAAYRISAMHGRGLTWTADAEKKVSDLFPRLEAESLEAYEKLGGVKAGADRLRKFARTWQGTTGGANALEAATVIGREELTRMTGRARSSTAKRRALQTFISRWEGVPVAREALNLLDAEARKEFQKLKGISSPSSRHKKLLAFAKEWAPSGIAQEAADIVEGEARELLEDIKNVFSTKERLSKLRSFARTYKGTTAGTEAQLAAERILKDLRK